MDAHIGDLHPSIVGLFRALSAHMVFAAQRSHWQTERLRLSSHSQTGFYDMKRPCNMRVMYVLNLTVSYLSQKRRPRATMLSRIWWKKT